MLAEHQVLIVDDEPSIRLFCRYALEAEGICCDEAANGVGGLEAVRRRRYDLVLLDIDMPGMNGPEVLPPAAGGSPVPAPEVIMFSGRASADEMAQMLLAGADDYLTKPFSVVQLQARVKAALRLKDAQDRSDLLNQHLLAVNHELEQNLDPARQRPGPAPATPWCWPWPSWWSTATARPAPT